MNAIYLLNKHQKLTNIICCPNCYGELSYPKADLFCNLPVAGKAICQKCGEVACITNFKFIFNSNSFAQFTTKSNNFSGLLKIIREGIDFNFLYPREAWHLHEKNYWSAEKNAKFSFPTQSLGVSLVFLKHPWSGIARVLIDSKEIGTIDLFEENGSMQIWYPIYLAGGEHLIEVVVTGTKNPLSKSTQVFLLAVEKLDLENSGDDGIHYISGNDGNPYPERFADLLTKLPSDALVLDCGSGDRCFQDHRVINFEYCAFPLPDIFGDGHKLPFKSNSFDLILSQAVIEHLYNPFTASSEIFRVLKPGGAVYAESAFMQPLHAVPYHFFNTTGWGLELLFKDFEIVETKYEGNLAQTLSWIYSLTGLRGKGLGTKLDQLLAIAGELDCHVTQEELKNFSSFISLYAKKPFGEIKDTVVDYETSVSD